MRPIFISALLVICQFCWSQSMKIGVQSGIGVYALKDMKEFNEMNLKNLPFDAKIVTGFPPYLYYRPSLLTVFDGYSLGLVFSFQSTASRISARDYSGEYKLDMKLRANSPGLYGEKELFRGKNFTASVYGLVSACFSDLSVTEYLHASDTTFLDGRISFKSLNFQCEPGLTIGYELKPFCFSLTFGNAIQFGEEALYTGGNKDYKLFNTRTNNPVKADWSGIRVGLGLSYNLSYK